MTYRLVRLSVLVSLVLVGACGGGGGSSSPTAPTTVYVPPPAPTITSITYSAPKTTLQVGETTKLTLTAHYSDGTTQTIPVTCTVWTGYGISKASDCTLTALAGSNGQVSFSVTYEGNTYTAYITVLNPPANLVFHKAAGGPSGRTEPYWWDLNTTGRVGYYDNWEYFGGYEGHGKNTGSGCAKNVKWTFTVYDAWDAQIEIDSGTNTASQIIRPGDVFEFDGCCLTTLADRVRDGLINLGSTSGRIDFSWTNVSCS